MVIVKVIRQTATRSGVRRRVIPRCVYVSARTLCMCVYNLSLSLSLYIYIYAYIIYNDMYIYIYIYSCIYN